MEDHQLYCFVAKMKQATVRDMHIMVSIAANLLPHTEFSGCTFLVFRTTFHMQCAQYTRCGMSDIFSVVRAFIFPFRQSL